MKNLDKFKKWLIQNGGEILPNTNEFELIRFKGDSVGVIYKSGKVSNPYTSKTIREFKNGKSWSGHPIKTGRKNTYVKEKKSIIKRDGDCCFYCIENLGDDITLEHLISLVKGGKNNLENMVLAHEKCNNEAGNKTVVEKVEIRVKNLLLKKV